ncbi:hypothetical protein Y032_0635g915 [Ancylostoma ceylanicum]|uniref:Uncharacterized protein n=1 Tax=Ancylostoma ceylanicum TaxID=53326 RepID=A0A016WLP5_9BILA|nr:hypothetical protein Y032_0635g915 [Ancylostoma ceylanicum]
MELTGFFTHISEWNLYLWKILNIRYLSHFFYKSTILLGFLGRMVVKIVKYNGFPERSGLSGRVAVYPVM